MAAAATDLTSLDPVMKTLYKGQRLQQAMYKKFQLYAIMPKQEDFVGRDMPLPIQFGDGGGRSATFTDAQANSQPPQFEDFLLTRVSDYGIGTIIGEAIESAASDKGSFVRGLKSVVDAKLRELVRSLAIAMFRDGSGYIGQVGSGEATPTVTLKNIADVANFERYDVVRVSGTNTITANRAGECTITGIDRSAGGLSIATGPNWDDNIAAIAVDDYIFIDGDAHNAVSYKKVRGLESWVPAAAPGAGLFFGVNRSVDSRLGGLRLDASAYALVEEAIVDAVGMVSDEGGECDLFVLHPTKFRKLVKEIGSKVQYDKLVAQGPRGAVAHISFRSVILDGPTGPVRILADRHCPSATGWALSMEGWKLYTLGSAPKFLMHDGNRILRAATADSYELRVGYRGQIGCQSPGWNCHTILP